MSHSKKEHSEGIASLDEMLSGTKLDNQDNAGQSGDTHGLSLEVAVAYGSVEKLDEDDQPYETGIVAEVELVGDESEHPVQSHEDRRPLNDNQLPADPDWK